MLTDQKKAELLKGMEGPMLSASEEEKERVLKVYELLEPSLHIRKDGRILLGQGHLAKTPLGLYRTLKILIHPDEKEKKLKEALKKIEHVSLNKSGISVLEIIHQLKFEKLL